MHVYLGVRPIKHNGIYFWLNKNIRPLKILLAWFILVRGVPYMEQINVPSRHMETFIIRRDSPGSIFLVFLIEVPISDFHRLETSFPVLQHVDIPFWSHAVLWGNVCY